MAKPSKENEKDDENEKDEGYYEKGEEDNEDRRSMGTTWG